MDDDLAGMSRDELVAEVKKLRAGIRKHRDSTGHELCWHHPDLWDLLPERTEPGDRRSALAEIHARLHPLPPVARRPGAGRAGPRQGIR